METAIDRLSRESRMKKKVFFLVAGGGFQWEALTLAAQIGDTWSFTYIVPESSIFPGSALVAAIGDAPRLVIPEVSSRANSRTGAVLRNLWRAIRIVWAGAGRTRPDAAVCVGSSMSIPIAAVCRLRGIPLVFVESITRTDALSSTGKLLLRLGMAQHFYVQWPEQTRLHPDVRYGGTVL